MSLCGLQVVVVEKRVDGLGGARRKLVRAMFVSIRASIEVFDQLGAQASGDRARAELRASGETARRRDPSTLHQLTPQALQIALSPPRAHQQGDRRPKLFLSPRTIDFHLRNVFFKLGTASRKDLSGIDLDQAANAERVTAEPL